MELILLYDYYGELLTQRQCECFEMRYHQDFSLGEIAQELGISRQGVHDNLCRTEAQLRNMEEKTGCVRRDMACRKAVHSILQLAGELAESEHPQVAELARQIMAVAQSVEE